MSIQKQPGAVLYAEEGKEGKETEIDNNNNKNKKSVAKEDTNLSIITTKECDSLKFNESRSNFLLMTTISAPFYYDDVNHAPIDLICVIDESGSMSGSLIALVKDTVHYIIDNLNDNDNFGLVGYSNYGRILLDFTKMTEANKIKAHACAAKLTANGATAMYDGLKKGIFMMKERKHKNDIASIMLLTDGHANIGPSTAEDMIANLTGKPKIIQNNSVEKKPGDWNCPLCNYLNFARNKTCKSCLKGKKPFNKSYSNSKPGDWVCSCGELNFARRKKCRKCNKMKPKDNNNNNSKHNKNKGKYNKNNKNNNYNNNNNHHNNNHNNNNNNDENKENENSNEFKLDCIINTFGFGGNHNEKLLETLAEFGNGMYAYIENEEMISDVFGECFGGLISTLALNCKLNITTLSNNINIVKCLSVGFKQNIITPNKELIISINDIQSEEKKNILLELNIPKINNINNDYNILRLKLTYTNTILDKKIETIKIIKLIRSNTNEGNNISNVIKLDEQKNRILVSETMLKVYNLNNYNKSKDILIKLKQDLLNSLSAKELFTINLINDINNLINNYMKDSNIFKLKGIKILKMNIKSHLLERSVQSSNYKSQKKYENYSKKIMKNKFLKGDWKCDKCGYKNFSRYNKCRMCQIGLRPRKKGDWECLNCNTLNFASRSLCYQCGKDKPNNNN